MYIIFIGLAGGVQAREYIAPKNQSRETGFMQTPTQAVSQKIAKKNFAL